jgi:hypothetical protein
MIEKPPRNSAEFCGGGHGLSWAVEPRKEEELQMSMFSFFSCTSVCHGVDSIYIRTGCRGEYLDLKREEVA